MEGSQGNGFAMETRLKALNPDLHRRFTAAVVALQYSLSRYRLVFPEYTDHSELHSLSVIDYCNQLIGDRIGRLNADELYILLTGCYLHDSGMGITREQYAEFCGQIDFGDYFDSRPKDSYATTIRDFHHEFSGLFIRKYADLFEIPSREHLKAIIQVARGHRRTDLMDEGEYPAAFPVPGGHLVCLPYLAAVTRLADEIDVTSSRNPRLLLDMKTLSLPKDILIHKVVAAVRSLDITESSFILHFDTDEPQVAEQLCTMAEKIQQTLDYCRTVVSRRTP